MAELEVYGGKQHDCPRCGQPLTTARTEHRDIGGDAIMAIVITDPGTAWPHIRDAHPDWWAQLVRARRAMNENPFIGGSKRRVDGVFLRPGEDVGNLGSAVA